ncbi:hypothetical protein AB4097_00900 [Microvirga sp. 2MCAF35]|uniref:hypothetical protein n=1 Tax=Microvirga sp. 2MCAF35 TaxID=3232987 RepID=UPI003F9AD6FA
MDEALKDSVTLGVAIAGLLLGTLNTLKIFYFDKRCKIKIGIKLAFDVRSGFLSKNLESVELSEFDNLELAQNARLKVEVINLSPFPIYVDEIAFMSGFFSDRRRGVLTAGGIRIPEGEMPYRLESRQSASFFSERGTLLNLRKNMTRVRVETSHGYLVQKKVRALARILDRLANVSSAAT